MISLHEIIKRRNNKKLRTYVAFIDFKKAYDLVPHEALLRKLYCTGIRGHVLNFISSQYDGSNIVLRNGNHYESSEIEVERGERQGCPSSPLFFDIFINDLLDGVRKYGVPVDGMNGGLLAGLLFADDVALISPTRSSLRKALKGISKWATKHEMKFGLSKCGIMGFGESGMTKVINYRKKWILGGEEVSPTSSYKYLGVPFTPQLDLKDIVEDRAKKGLGAFESLYPILSCGSIPMRMKIQLVKTCLIPVLSYGSELWGLHESRANTVQRILNKAMKVLVGMTQSSHSTSFNTLSVELNIPTMIAVTSAARVRAFYKYQNSKTIIGILVHNTVKGRNWVSETTNWVKKRCPECTGLCPKKVVLNYFNRKLICQRSVTLDNYLNLELNCSRSLIEDSNKYVNIAKGVQYLTKIRIGAFWTCPKLVKIGWINNLWQDTCPCCLHNEPESIYHIVLECSTWIQQRNDYLLNLISIIGNFFNTPTINWNEYQKDLAMKLLMGGTVNFNNGSFCLFNYQSGTYYYVALFLQEVLLQRRRLVGRLINPLRADANAIGMAALVQNSVQARVRHLS